MKLPFVALSRVLLTLAALAGAASGLTCFVGDGDDYKPVDCLATQSECSIGVGCLCMKAPDINGKAKRMCWANPHNGQRPMCFLRTEHEGAAGVEICTCDSDLCNSSSFTGISLITLVLTIFGSEMIK